MLERRRLVSTLEPLYEVRNWFQAFAFKCSLHRYTQAAVWRAVLSLSVVTVCG
jgi:hypothetical protein